MLPTRDALNYKDTNMLKIKEWKNIYHENIKLEKLEWLY